MSTSLIQGSKRCAGCAEVKPRSDFYRDNRASDGLRSSCKACQIARNSAWNRTHPKKLREAGKRFYWANQEAVKQRAREHWRGWRADPQNAELHRQRSRRWYHANREKALATLNKRVRGLPPLDAESQMYASVLRSDPCAYCGGPMEDVDHIDPIVAGGRNHWTNLTAACGTCNNRKYSHPLLIALHNAGQ